MKIWTKKHLFKKSINEKAYGCIDVLVESETKELYFRGSVIGDYDVITDFDTTNIKKAMEILFNEDIKEERGLIEWGEGSQQNS